MAWTPKKAMDKIYNDNIIQCNNCHGDGLDENMQRQWTVWGGSQRIRVATDLGYTHIDCAIIPSLDEARTLQGKMRAPFTQRYY